MLNSLQQENMYSNFNMVGDEEDEDFFEIDEESRMALEKKQMKQAIRESQYLQFLDEQRRHSVSGSRPSMFMSGMICKLKYYNKFDIILLNIIK